MFDIQTGLKLLKRNYVSHLLAVLILALSLIAIAFCANYVISLYKPVHMAENLGKGYLYSPNYGNGYDNANLTAVESNSSVYESSGFAGGKVVNVYAYDGYFEENAKVALKKGQWYTDAEKSSGYYNAVVSDDSGFAVGDVISLFIGIGIDSKTVNLKITGLLPSGFYYYKLSNINTPETADSILELHKGDDLPIILTDHTAIEEFVIDYYKYIVFSDGISDSDMESNLDYLEVYGRYASLDTITANTREIAREASMLYIPLTVLMIAFSILGLIAVSGITINQNKKMFAVLFYCGAKPANITRVIISFMSALFGIAVAIYAIVTCILNVFLAEAGTYLPSKAVFWCTLVCTLLPVVGTSLLLGRKAGNKLAQTIKEE